MAVVLSSEDNGLFASSALRRSHSQPKFNSKQSQNFHSSASSSRINDLFHDTYDQQPVHIVPGSVPSSAPSSPRALQAESSDPSYTSTPATNLSLDGQCEDGVRIHPEDPVILSEFDSNSYFGPLEDLEPPPSPRTGDSYTVSPTEQTASANTSRPGSPDLLEHAEDDTAVKHHPTQHVDYLSHNWKEEDIWSSWRYIVSKKKDFSNGPRLENASWRTWMKAKYKLKTVSPETLNWLKDCDVTWLYGPLQTRQGKLFSGELGHGSSTLSRADSFVMSKKPILKKRSMSEIMLQRSLSSSSLLKQATAVVQAQQQDGTARITRPILHRATTDYITFPFCSRRSENTSLAPSSTTSGIVSPSAERKHIHFDEQVKQCIAVDIKGDDDDDDELDQHHRWRFDDSDSDDGAIMMKRTKTRKRPVILRRRSPVNTNNESKTIAMLPSTTLKYREDSPAPPETAIKHSTGELRGSLLSPSPSQETLRPSKTSGAFFIDDEGDEIDEQVTNPTPISSPVEPTSHSWLPNLQRTSSTNSSTAEIAGMRRTESGMLMPYEEGETQGNDGIIGRVIDTVNTARDIAHVIWNVGWRR
ncbi:protein phosphatase type 1 complex subunit Hex2/Reg1 [Biscogniauxia sp. FL1348]|nr:protein phosphatase type 1 complex subunit Hex2/Reg1 [Biscogniauxia sp. FL1348]